MNQSFGYSRQEAGGLLLLCATDCGALRGASDWFGAHAVNAVVTARIRTPFAAEFERSRGRPDRGGDLDYLARGRDQTLFASAGKARLFLPNAPAGAASSSQGKSKTKGLPRMRVAIGVRRGARAGAALPGCISCFRGTNPNRRRTDLPINLASAARDLASGVATDGAGSVAIAASLSPDGTQLLFSTCVEGGDDAGKAIAVAAADRAYAAGITESADFPSPLQDEGRPHNHRASGLGIPHDGFNGGERDAFLVCLRETGKTLDYARLVDGSGFEVALGAKADGLRHAHVVNLTNLDGAALLHPVQTIDGGRQQDVVLLGVDGDDRAHTYSSYLGGSGAGRGRAIAVSPDEEAQATGETVPNELLVAGPWPRRLAGATQFGGDAVAAAPTGPTWPAAPTSVTAAPRSRAAVRIRWDDQRNDETSFAVERSDGAAGSAKIATTGPNAPLRVFAVNSSGRSEPSAVLQALIAASAWLTVSTKRAKFSGVRTGACRRQISRLHSVEGGLPKAWLGRASATRRRDGFEHRLHPVSRVRGGGFGGDGQRRWLAFSQRIADSRC